MGRLVLEVIDRENLQANSRALKTMGSSPMV